MKKIVFFDLFLNKLLENYHSLLDGTWAAQGMSLRVKIRVAFGEELKFSPRAQSQRI